MQRLISLFQEPQDPWPSLARHESDEDEDEAHPARALKAEPRDPLYFVELMAYLRERNRAAARAPKFEPREGAD